MNARRHLTRRRFLIAGALAAPTLVAADGFGLEPTWLKVRRLDLAAGQPRCRLVHCSDLHHKGDRGYLREIIDQINGLEPELVCFTGDFMEDTRYLDEALDMLGTLRAPLVAVPGNHDHWSGADFGRIDQALRRTGGRLLVDDTWSALEGRVALHGIDRQPHAAGFRAGALNVVLMHYPVFIERLPPRKFDLVLAGHSHGGQVRLPLYGALVVPFNVGRYDLGLFRTERGPMYVTSGLGWWKVRVRIGCRPEIVLITL